MNGCNEIQNPQIRHESNRSSCLATGERCLTETNPSVPHSDSKPSSQPLVGSQRTSTSELILKRSVEDGETLI
ncbi:hypothetical protein RJT34_32732 [Clitoria ternatea]|uniref:Uncharacterized protein n=1 Tax=Clitoria ternatea TaxID=43366 RepID=A0AAN9EXH1_CLITE